MNKLLFIGFVKYFSEGIINFYLDVLDVVNCMVYVGIFFDGFGGK